MIHKDHPNGGTSPHPLKFTTLCGKLVRFGSGETDTRKANCKICLKIAEKICPTCGGTGVKSDAGPEPVTFSPADDALDLLTGDEK